jgi:hypothetical protein
MRSSLCSHGLKGQASRSISRSRWHAGYKRAAAPKKNVVGFRRDQRAMSVVGSVTVKAPMMLKYGDDHNARHPK